MPVANYSKKNAISLYEQSQSPPVGLRKIFIDYFFFQADQWDCTKSSSIVNRFASSEQPERAKFVASQFPTRSLGWLVNYGRRFVSKLGHDIRAVFSHGYLQSFLLHDIHGFFCHVYLRSFLLCGVFIPKYMTGLLTGCGKKWEILRHFQGKLCSKKGLLCGKLCDFFKADLTLFF